MGTLKQKLEYIKETKKQIGDAIVAKGGTVSNKFRDYATAIQNLPSGGGSSCEAGICFSEIGYSMDDVSNLPIKSDVDYSKQKYDAWHPSETSAVNLYGDSKLIYAPKIDTSNVTNMTNMFQSCFQLKYVPVLDTSSVTDMSNMFYYCNDLKEIPMLDTSSVTSMRYMFGGCTNLKEIPALNTSSVTDMSNMFSNCSNLDKIPLLDTSSVTDMSYMFRDCPNLKEIPALNTSSVTNMSYMFNRCRFLDKIPLLDTSSVTNMSDMFSDCINLKEIPALNTSSVTDMSYMFSDCTYLKEIPALNTSSVTDMSNMFAKCDNTLKIEELSFKSVNNVTNMFGSFGPFMKRGTMIRYLLIKDLGTQSSLTTLDWGKALMNWGDETPISGSTVDITGAKQTVVDSLLTYSFDRKSVGYPNCNISLHNKVKSCLTEEQITAIQNKGYELSFVS